MIRILIRFDSNYLLQYEFPFDSILITFVTIRILIQFYFIFSILIQIFLCYQSNSYPIQK